MFFALAKLVARSAPNQNISVHARQSRQRWSSPLTSARRVIPIHRFHTGDYLKNNNDKIKMWKPIQTIKGRPAGRPFQVHQLFISKPSN
jgi:hypothetical protein